MWSFDDAADEPASHAGLVTIVEGSSFCLSEPDGDIRPMAGQGAFFSDARVVSRLELYVNGRPTESIDVARPDPFTATFVSHCADEPSILVVRRRYVGQGLREDLLVRSHAATPVDLRVELRIDADFADLFAVKEGRARPAPELDHRVRAERLIFEGRVAGRLHTLVAAADGAQADAGRLTWHIPLAPGAEWSTCVQLMAGVDESELQARYPCDLPVESAEPIQRLMSWRDEVADVVTEPAELGDMVRRGVDDVGSLRIFDPDHPTRPIVAAGAPWFMTLFGRDSLLSAWMMLPVDPALCLGVLETLAELQGRTVDDTTEEQPGRILHEVRFGSSIGLGRGGSDVYYGTVDATPLFVMTVAEAWRWGVDPDPLRALLPACRRAVGWIDEHGDRDRDGFVEYQRPGSETGLRNQGWKDSWNGVTDSSGAIPDPPIALCEVQGYVYAARLGLAELEDAFGDPALAARQREAADRLRRRFDEAFWMPDRGAFALGLDGDKVPIDALASNMGHCLWTGIAMPSRTASVADHLAGPTMFSGWGVRTLAAGEGAYDPLSYHNGSVWPHDTALCAAGLMRYGHVAAAHRLIGGLVDAAGVHRDALPELFAGIGRDEIPVPVRYPSACSPQAWAAAAPALALRTLLRIDPTGPGQPVHIAPALPDWLTTISVQGLHLGASRLAVSASPDGAQVETTGEIPVIHGPLPVGDEGPTGHAP